ncbi:MAG: TetR/AcrR family transcriptional regulator [Leptospira sp.]|nr:TetR/AcrR family transcriptional regulator [Leptospira sp.]
MSQKIENNYLKFIECFTQLIEEKSYDEISIQDITNRTEMSRVNFYNYFSDKEDLMWKTFQYHFLTMNEKVEKIDPVTLLSDGKPLTYYWFEIIRKNRIFFYSLFIGGMPYSLEIKILDYLQKESYRTHEVLRMKYKNKSIPYIRINQYLTGALVHLTRELLRENDEWDSEEIATFFTKLSVPGIIGMMDV